MKHRLIAICMFIAYSAILVKVMVLKDLPVIRTGSMIFNFGGSRVGPANLTPFKTILPYLLGKKGFLIAGINLIGNIILLVPIGFLVPFVFPSMTWKKTIVLAVAAGFFIEAMQAFLQVGIFDIDDIILNGVGVVTGYWIFTIIGNRLRSVKPATIITVIIIVVAAAATLYFSTVHQEDRLPDHVEPVAVNGEVDSTDNKKVNPAQNNDPCAGTGGTGQIVELGNNHIAIKRHDGTCVVINFTTHTSIRNAVGAVLQADLKIGDRVTVVVDLGSDGTGTATTVLVCNDRNQQNK